MGQHLIYTVYSDPSNMADVTGDTDTYLEHIWVDVKKREVKIMDNEGYDEIVTWEFNEDGVDGFTETIQHFKRLVPDDMITYL